MIRKYYQQWRQYCHQNHYDFGPCIINKLLQWRYP